MKKEKPQAEEKSRYRKIIDGEIEPEGIEKGWINLREGQTKYNLNNLPPEKAREIRRKGFEAQQKLHGEKKTARESLEKILTLKIDDDLLNAAELPDELIRKIKRDNPDATIYDMIQLVAVGRAAGGSMAAIQYIRDTHGDAPKSQVEVSGQIMTDQDRQLIKQISDRMKSGEHLEVVKDI